MRATPIAQTFMRARESEQESAFRTLYAENRLSAWIYARSIVGDQSAAEDVVATVFEKLWKRRARLDLKAQGMRSYLMSAIRTTAIDELRARSRRAIPFEDLGEFIERGDSEPSSPNDGGLVRELLMELDSKERELIVLRYWLDLSNGEIAELTGITVTNVSTKISRILERLSCDERLIGDVQ